MPKKLTLYLDTTVINYLLADHLPLEKKVTEKLFKKIRTGEYKTYISNITEAEIEATPEPKRSKLENILATYTLNALELDLEARKLAQSYIKAKAVAPKHIEDVYHIAIATVNKIEALVSWNLDHIVRLHTKEIVDKVNQELGYPLIYICTPREVI